MKISKKAEESMEDCIMLTQSLAKAQKTNRRWLLLAGGVAFLISLVLPTLLAFITRLPGWIVILLVLSHSLPSMLMMVAILAGFALLLALFTLFLWSRIVNQPGNATVGRGLLAFLLADILALLVSCLLYFIINLLLFGRGTESQGFLLITVFGTAIAQALYSLPFLLIAGAILGYLQGREQQRVA
jgi:hypothetical protein